MNVLIVGSSGGIGKSIVKSYLSKNHNLILPLREDLDLSSSNSIKYFFKNKNKYYIDIFIHSAGINKPKDFLNLKRTDIEKTLQINVCSMLEISQYILPHMISNNFGRIISISSLWSILSKSNRCAYSLSKSALDSLIRNLAVEFGKHNILANSIVPGFVDTQLTRNNLSKQEILKIIEKTPTKSFVPSNEISKLAYYLGVENNAITGQSIIVDGGYSISG